MALPLMRKTRNRQTNTNLTSRHTGNRTLARLEGVEKVYQTGRLEFPALRGIDLTIDRGELRRMDFSAEAARSLSDASRLVTIAPRSAPSKRASISVCWPFSVPCGGVSPLMWLTSPVSSSLAMRAGQWSCGT